MGTFAVLDIETLDISTTDSVITEVAFIVVKDGERLIQEVTYPSIVEQIFLGRTISKETIDFHLKNGYDKIYDPSHQITLDSFIKNLTYKLKDVEAVWINGMDFDLGNLNKLRQQVGIDKPLWNFRATRDYRTIRVELGVRATEEEKQQHRLHTAMGDCEIMLYGVNRFYELKEKLKVS